MRRNGCKKATNALIVFEHALAYNPDTKRVEPKLGEDGAVAAARWAFLGQHIPADEAEHRALGLITPNGDACELAEVNLAAAAAMGARLTEEMIEPARRSPCP